MTSTPSDCGGAFFYFQFVKGFGCSPWQGLERDEVQGDSHREHQSIQPILRIRHRPPSTRKLIILPAEHQSIHTQPNHRHHHLQHPIHDTTHGNVTIYISLILGSNPPRAHLIDWNWILSLFLLFYPHSRLAIAMCYLSYPNCLRMRLQRCFPVSFVIMSIQHRSLRVSIVCLSSTCLYPWWCIAYSYTYLS